MSNTFELEIRKQEDEKKRPYHALKDESHVVPMFQSPKSQIIIPEDKIAIAASLLVFSLIGVTIRIYSEKLFSYIGEPVTSTIYPQIVGCFIMGVATELKAKIEITSHTLFVGIATGLCGSITTFSGVIIGASQQLFDVLDYDRSVAHNLLGGLTVCLLGFGLGYLALLFGRHLGEWLKNEYFPQASLENAVYAQPVFFNKKNLSKADKGVLILGGLGTSIVLIASLVVEGDRRLIYALVFAPFGTFLRRYLSFFNPRNKRFPLGTFWTNVTGSGILVCLFLIPGSMSIDRNQCFVISGLMSGFCGCFTTVSTWVAELYSLNRKDAYVYGGGSIICAQILSIIVFLIMGSEEHYNNICTAYT